MHAFRKFVSIIILISFIFTIAPIPPALALRNPQPENAHALSHAVGIDMQAADNKAQGRSYAGAIGRDEFLSLISRIDVAAYKQVKDIFLNSKTVADDINALYDSGRLFEIFPFLKEMEGITKVVSEKEGNYFTHTLGFLRYFEGILSSRAAAAETNLFSKDKSRNFPYKGLYQGESPDFGVWSALSDKFKSLIKTPEDKETLFLIALLHDIGTPIDVTSHDLEGESLIEAVFERLGFSRDRIERAKWIVANHTVIGVIATRERTPKYLFDRIGGLSKEELDYRLKLLGLLAICDLRSMNDGRFLSNDVFDFYNNANALNTDGLRRCQDNWHISRLAVFESPANMGHVDRFQEGSAMSQYYMILRNEMNLDEDSAFTYNLKEFIERFDYAIRTFWKFDNKLTLLKLIYLIHRILEEVKSLDSLKLNSARISFPPERDFGKDIKSQEENIRDVIKYLDSVFEDMESVSDFNIINVDDIKEAVRKIDFSPLKTEKTVSFDIYGIPMEVDLTQPGTLRLFLKLDKMDITGKSNAAGEVLKGLIQLAEEYARKLDTAREDAKKNPTKSNKELFGLTAERLMLILNDARTVKNLIIENGGNAKLKEEIDLDRYKSPMRLTLKSKDAEAVTRYSLFPAEKINPAKDVATVGMKQMSKEANVLMAGGAGTRLQELYYMTDEEREKIGAGDLTEEELKAVSKPTIPYSKIMHKSPIVIILESLRRIAQDTADEPVIIITGPDTEKPILDALRKNNYFGLKEVVVRRQGSIPVYNTYNERGEVIGWGPVESRDGGVFIESPDGGGGTVMALGSKGFLFVKNGQETFINDKSPLEWLNESHPQIEGINFLQTDMAIEAETITGLIGTRVNTGSQISAMVYDYPRRVLVKVKKDTNGNLTKVYIEDEFTLGTFFSTGEDTAANVEYGERNEAIRELVYKTRHGITLKELQEKLEGWIKEAGGLDEINKIDAKNRQEFLDGLHLQQKLDLLLTEHKGKALNPGQIIPANTGAYSVTKDTVEDIILNRKLKPHVQPKKDRKKADNKKIVSDNLEFFAPDMFEYAEKASVTLVDEGDALPTKDAKKFAESRDYFGKRHETKLRSEFGVAETNIGEGAVIEFSPLFRGSIDSSLKVGKKAKLYLGGSYAGRGYEIKIGKNVEIADNTTLKIEGNGPVTIEDGARFISGAPIILKSRVDGQPLVVTIDDARNIQAEAGAIGKEKQKLADLLMKKPPMLQADDTRVIMDESAQRDITRYVSELPDDNPLLLTALTEIVNRLMLGDYEMAIVDETHPAFKGLTDDVRRLLLQAGATSAVESVYEKKIMEFTHRNRTALSDAEIEALLKALPDEKAAEFILVLRAYGFNDVVSRIRDIFKTMKRSLPPEAQKAYKSVMDRNIICPRTKLAMGDPYAKPFPVIAEGGEINSFLKKLMEEMRYEDTERFAVKSASGIRSIFDYYLRRNGTSSRISDASKIHVAIITQAFIDFLKRYPAYVKKHNGESKSAPTIVIGSDTRSTSPAISDIIIRTLLSLAGIKVNIKYLGVCSVSEIVAYTQSPQADADAFIYVSASHNPKGNNGVKLGFADGKLLDPFLANKFIKEFKEMFKDSGIVKKTIARLNNVSPKKIKDILESAVSNKKESKKAYDAFSDGLMKNKAEMRRSVKEQELYFVVDSNGGARARQEANYYRTLGYKVVEINSRARYDMNHDLCPRNEACDDLVHVMNQLLGEGKKVVGGLVFDTDGDRQNFVFVDKDGKVRPLGVQGIFALNALCALMEQIVDRNIEPSGMSVVVNDATSIMLEAMAEKLGFHVQRCETGEPVVVETGEKLYDVLHSIVAMMGEGSNGGSFTLDLKVREPRHAIRTITTLLLRPELFKEWCRRTGAVVPKSYTIADIIRTLPIEYTTDFFDEREVRRGALPIPPRLLKAEFEGYFAKRMWPEIKKFFTEEKAFGIKARDLEYQFVRNEGRPVVKLVDGKVTVVSEARGPNNEMTELGAGGLKVEILAKGKKIAWLWFRKSGTEPLQRRGASVSLWLEKGEDRMVVEDAIRGTRRVLNDILHRSLSAVEKRTQADIINTLTKEPQTSEKRQEFILAYAYEKDPESALKKIKFPEDRLGAVLGEIHSVKEQIDKQGALAVEARAIVENNEELFNKPISAGIKLGWLIVKVYDVSGLDTPYSIADIYNGALVVRINSESGKGSKAQLEMAIENMIKVKEAALVIGPNDGNRARAVQAFSGAYEKVFEAEDIDTAKKLIYAENDKYAITRVADLTKIYTPNAGFTRQIRNNFGMVDLITIGDPSRIEEIIRQSV